MDDYFELAQGSSMRMCRELEKRFPDLRGRQLELMMYLCIVAYNSEIYDGVCDDAWLRTTIKLKNHRRHVFSYDSSPELLKLMQAGISDNPVLCQANWEWLQTELSTLTSRIEICSNILPRKAYLERLQELQESIALDNSSTVLNDEDVAVEYPGCCMSGRGFYPITVINQARLKDVRLKEKVDEWRRDGGSCDLATHLRQRKRTDGVQHTARRAPLRYIERNDIEYSMEKDKLGEGAAATVFKVSWRNGTYAMKSYKGSLSQKEQDVVSRVWHPHIVHGFGFFEANGESGLLMEVLGKSLMTYALEEVRVDDKPRALFSRADTFDVLLQIASAMEHLHLNNVVHGDVKPDNILLDSFEMLGNERHFLAKVTDFDQAQFIVPGIDFSPGGDGTTKCAAPELLEWRENRLEVKIADPRKIDVYSFGAVAHEVLTGYPVYYETRVITKEFKTNVIKGKLKPSESKEWRNSGLKEKFPVELIELLEKCWELHPEDRPSFSEICAALEKCKSMVQNMENRAANRWKLIAAVFLLAFICWLSSLITVKRDANPFKFIAMILLAFIPISYLMKFCVRVFLFAIRSGISSFAGQISTHSSLQ